MVVYILTQLLPLLLLTHLMHATTLFLCTHTTIQQTFNHYGIPPSELAGAVPKYFPATNDDVYEYNGRSYSPEEQKDILASVQSAYYFSIAGS
jgi:hypothetical protein